MILKKLRIRYELTQEDLTEYLEMDQKTYHNIENKLTKRIKIEVLIKLAFLYDVSIDYLVGATTTKKEFPTDKKEELMKKYNINLYLVRKLREKGSITNQKAPTH